MIKQLPPLSEDVILRTFDVGSFYTNIPHEGGLKTIYSEVVYGTSIESPFALHFAFLHADFWKETLMMKKKKKKTQKTIPFL